MEVSAVEGWEKPIGMTEMFFSPTRFSGYEEYADIFMRIKEQKDYYFEHADEITKDVHSALTHHNIDTHCELLS